MARKRRGKLTEDFVSKAGPGTHSDGNNLYLEVGGANSASYIFRFRFGSRTPEMGLGSARSVSLSEARDRADEYNRMLRDNIDPLKARNEKRAAARLQDARSISFDEAARQYFEKNKHAWKNAKHVSEWLKTLTDTRARCSARSPSRTSTPAWWSARSI